MSRRTCAICGKEFDEKDVKICMVCKSYKICNPCFHKLHHGEKRITGLKIFIED